MDEDGFWKIVQRAHDSSGGDMDQKCDALRQQISALSKDEALEFAQHFDAMMDKAYDWPLWGAAYVINGGCSDDTFSDFRAALISRGRQAFERALSDPDSLADEAFEDQTGSTKAINMPSPMVSKRLPAIHRRGLRRPSLPEPSGRRTRSTTCFRNSVRNLGDWRGLVLPSSATSPNCRAF